MTVGVPAIGHNLALTFASLARMFHTTAKPQPNPEVTVSRNGRQGRHGKIGNQSLQTFAALASVA
jgi:hypothetical protein